MNIVKSAQMSLIDLLEKESFFEKKAIKQNSTELIRYTRTKDFTEEVAIQYFQKEKDLLKAFQIIRKLNIAPYFSV